MFKKSPLNAIHKNILKLPLLEVNTNTELRKQETITDTAKATIVARIGEIRLARYKQIPKQTIAVSKPAIKNFINFKTIILFYNFYIGALYSCLKKITISSAKDESLNKQP